MMGALYYLLSIANLVCFILVLIKLFKKEGVLLGILGIICGLYTFIWGWINHKKQGITNIMIIWTILVIIQVVYVQSTGVNPFMQM
ncbi:hypothetical protein GF407_19530 [candidate division KSB1 bacterium]|nr:hypothetical protein [candidate division KSB1 bacterium]